MSDIFNPSTLTVDNNGTVVAAEQGINFINGANVTITTVDNPSNNRVDVTIAASGGGGGGSPGGLNTQVQYNNAGAFGGITEATTNGTTLTTNNQVLNGTVSGTAVSTTATANDLVLRDGNANAFANNFISATANVVSAGTQTNLVPNSARLQILTGTLNQTFRLPNANSSGMVNGSRFDFNNNSTGVLNVNDFGGNLQVAIDTGAYCILILTDNSTANGVWDVHSLIPKNSSWSTNGAAVTGTLSATGHVTFEGVTSTGATGTGNLVFSGSPTLVNPVVGTQIASDDSTLAASTAFVALASVNPMAYTYFGGV